MLEKAMQCHRFSVRGATGRESTWFIVTLAALILGGCGGGGGSPAVIEPPLQSSMALAFSDSSSQNVALLIAPDGSRTLYRGMRNATGSVTSIDSAQVLTPAGNSTINAFDGIGRVISSRSLSGLELTFRYSDSAGTVTASAIASDGTVLKTSTVGSTAAHTSARPEARALSVLATAKAVSPAASASVIANGQFTVTCGDGAPYYPGNFGVSLTYQPTRAGSPPIILTSTPVESPTEARFAYSITDQTFLDPVGAEAEQIARQLQARMETICGARSTADSLIKDLTKEFKDIIDVNPELKFIIGGIQTVYTVICASFKNVNAIQPDLNAIKTLIEQAAAEGDLEVLVVANGGRATTAKAHITPALGTIPMISVAVPVENCVSIAFSASEYIAGPNTTTVQIQLIRSGPVTANSTAVLYSYLPGTAVPGKDYVANAGTQVIFSPSTKTITFDVELLPGRSPGGSTLDVQIQSVGRGGVGQPSSALLKILPSYPDVTGVWQWISFAGCPTPNTAACRGGDGNVLYSDQSFFEFLSDHTFDETSYYLDGAVVSHHNSAGSNWNQAGAQVSYIFQNGYASSFSLSWSSSRGQYVMCDSSSSVCLSQRTP